jgi:succinate dehydrogenase/fumarate reductase cytochrome b subunit
VVAPPSGHLSLAEAIGKVHRLSGFVPLAAFVVLHAWVQGAITGGRDPALERLESWSAPTLEALLVLLPLLLHAVCGLWLARHGPPAVGYASPAFRGFQALTGVVTALFLVGHVGWVWGARLSGQGPLGVYAAMSDQTAGSAGVGFYVLGISAVCLHLGQGLAVGCLRLFPACPPSVARGLGTLLGGGVWLVFLNALAAYATGGPLM